MASQGRGKSEQCRENRNVGVVDRGSVLCSGNSSGAPVARASFFPPSPSSDLGRGRWVATKWQGAMGER